MTMWQYEDYYALEEHHSVPLRVAPIVGYRDGQYRTVAKSFAAALGRPDDGVKSRPTVETLWRMMALLDDVLDRPAREATGQGKRIAMRSVQDLNRGDTLTVLEELGFGEERLPSVTVADAAPAYRTVLARQLMLCLEGRFDYDWRPHFRKPKK